MKTDFKNIQENSQKNYSRTVMTAGDVNKPWI